MNEEVAIVKPEDRTASGPWAGPWADSRGEKAMTPRGNHKAKY